METINYNVFDQNLNHLEILFGKNEIAKRIIRLREIFHSTETSWQLNLNRIAEKQIQNILIAEAAPWSDNGTPRFFYNRIESSYHQRIWSAFFPHLPIPNENESAFNMLSEKNFLLIDTIPFSMSYKGKRKHTQYLELIANSLPWWTNKLQNEKISYAENVNIAFAFNVHGLSVINAMGGEIKLKDGQKLKLTNKLIAADKSGYTSSEKLRNIYSL